MVACINTAWTSPARETANFYSSMNMESPARAASLIGPPLVFLPGAGGSASFWRPVADRLVDLGHVHVFGYPGFGGTPADPNVNFIDALYRWVFEQKSPGL